jgi:CheY-like chemotaxis protein
LRHEGCSGTRPMKTILVVDDDHDIAELAALVLATEGYRVHQASDGLRALGKLAGAPVDLIVTDIMMPDMDGRELARAVRGQKDFALIPIIGMSAASNADGPDPEQPLFDCFLSKPFHVNELTEQVSILLESVAAGESLDLVR